MEGVPEAVAERAAVEAAALHQVLTTALACRELVAGYDRLAGTALAARRTPLEQAIDAATGRDDRDHARFLAFAKDVLWDRAPEATRDAVRAQVRRALTGHPNPLTGVHA